MVSVALWSRTVLTKQQSNDSFAVQALQHVVIDTKEPEPALVDVPDQPTEHTLQAGLQLISSATDVELQH